MTYLESLNTDQAFDRYEAVRDRLPVARFPGHSIMAGSLSDMADAVDGFVLDAFGVLNVGETPIPGAVARMAQLRARGKRLAVLTNAASYTRQSALAKYHKLGFDFAAHEVVSSRDTCAARLDHLLPGGVWGAISADGDSFADLRVEIVRWTASRASEVDGFVILSSQNFDPETEAALTEALMRRPRPLVVANPDIVAPRETDLSCEPGFFAHRIADRTGVSPVFFGKPFADAYEDVLVRLGGLAPERVAMVGDTLHTDVLGGAAAGLRTVLISGHGIFAGRDPASYIARSGIRPDYICATT